MSADSPNASAVDKKVAPVDLLWEESLLLDASVEEAWRHVINYPSWQDYSSVEHVSGTPGAEGEVVLLRKDEEGFSFPPYYGRTLKLDPPHRVMWKTYPVDDSDGAFTGIVEFTLADLDGRTRFSFKSLYEFMVPYEDAGELAEFRQGQEENFAVLFASTNQKLREVVEAN